MIFRAFLAHSVGRWQFHIETTVSSLRAIPLPSDMYYMSMIWNRLEEPDLDTDRMEEGPLQDLLLILPDGWAISWAIGRCFCWKPGTDSRPRLAAELD